MKKLAFIFMLILASLCQTFAQHCPWDFYVILVVDIRSDTDSCIIKDLEVTLIDSLDNDVMIEIWIGNEWVRGIARLWQNSSKTTYHDVNPVNPKKFRFWFAEDDYVLFCNESVVHRASQIKIVDADGEKNQGDFRTTLVEISNGDFYPLCTNYSKWDSGEKYCFVKNYRPVKVILSEK